MAHTLPTCFRSEVKPIRPKLSQHMATLPAPGLIVSTSYPPIVKTCIGVPAKTLHAPRVSYTTEFVGQVRLVRPV